MRAYLAAHAAGVHERHFGWKTFRVLVVTTDRHRLQSMTQALHQLHIPHSLGAPLFFFATRDDLRAADPITYTWQDGAGKPQRLHQVAWCRRAVRRAGFHLTQRLSARIVAAVPAIFRKLPLLAGKRQAVRPWRLPTQDCATPRQEFPMAEQRSAAATDASRVFGDKAGRPGRLLAQPRIGIPAQGRERLQHHAPGVSARWQDCLPRGRGR